MMSRAVLFGAAMLAIPAAAQPVSDPGPRDAYLRCIGTQTSALDDQTSPAETIALAVASVCMREGRAVYASSREGRYILERASADELRDMIAHLAAKAVLRYRATMKQ